MSLGRSLVADRGVFVYQEGAWSQRGCFKYIHHMKGVAAKQSWLITYQRGDSIRVRDVFLQGFMTTVPFSDVLSHVEPFPPRPLS